MVAGGALNPFNEDGEAKDRQDTRQWQILAHTRAIAIRKRKSSIREQDE
jgi:hypothetical protein